MFEYIISDYEESEVVLYHLDEFSKKDMLKMLQDVAEEVDNEEGTELLIATTYTLCSKFGFVNKSWMEYKYNIPLDFENVRELHRSIKEELYQF